jgi:hypothetical protein
MNTLADATPIVRIATVHGTGDTADSPEGQKWFQVGSLFCDRLKQHLAEGGVHAEIVPHLWSGANSAMARDAAARALQREVSRLARSAQVHIIGHSHGGNVADDAARRLNWRPGRRRPRLGSVTAVGTPFLRARVRAWESALIWFFLVLTLIGAGSTLWLASEATHRGWWWVAIVNLVIMPFFAFRAIRRAQHARQRKQPEPRVHAIRHPHDEAISFLQHVEALRLEPLRRWSLARGAGPMAILVGMPLGIALLCIQVAFGLANLPIDPQATWLHNVVVAIQPILIESSAYAVLAFGVGYLAYRLFALLVLEFGLRGMLNNSIGGTLKGIALGRDGDLRVGAVSTQSHHFGTTETILSEEIVQRMNIASEAATARLFDKYRKSLFSVGADASNAIIEIAHDSMTWDSLIHTTYFDQPEMAQIIGDHILAALRASPTGLPARGPRTPAA